MIRPEELGPDLPRGRRAARNDDMWAAISAAAAGDIRSLGALLDRDPDLGRAEYCCTQPIHFAVREEHLEAVRLLLEAGADPDGLGPGGESLITVARDRGYEAIARLLEDVRPRHGRITPAEHTPTDHPIHAAAAANDVALVRTMLDADPRLVDPELRALLFARGGSLDPYDLVWLGDDDEVVRRVIHDPGSATAGCGGVFTAAATLGKRELVMRLLDAGLRVPPVLTACRSYLLEDAEILRLLLASGMNPNLPNWQLATPLHDLCARDGRGRPRALRVECATILLDAGAAISARDEEYRSTPLAWAARSDLPDMVELLLARGAPTNLPDDEPWATPLAWATRRGHSHIATMLRSAGATA